LPQTALGIQVKDREEQYNIADLKFLLCVPLLVILTLNHAPTNEKLNLSFFSCSARLYNTDLIRATGFLSFHVSFFTRLLFPQSISSCDRVTSC
jgi:hypothetical protein